MTTLKKTLLVIGACVVAFIAYAIIFNDPNYEARRLYEQMCKQNFVQTGQPCKPFEPK
jgi:hypothetical protein